MAQKLRLMKSPVVGGEKSGYVSASSTFDHGIDQEPVQTREVPGLGGHDALFQDYPEFEKHEEATAGEVFYDLFFAANLTVFSDNHDVTDTAQLSAYFAYFIALWLTWALVGLFDVRYTTDSIFERVSRAAHLGVMVGIAVVAPNFNPTSPKASTFRIMSIVFMASRLALAAQYSSIIWHVRKFKDTKTPLGIMVGLNCVTAIIYLGVAFGFKDVHTYLYATWYIVAILELIITVGLSLYYKVLSFKGTHLISRVSLLTYILIGEGVGIVCLSVGRIVNQPDSWTSPTIGNVVAGTTNLYIVFQIYIDFMRHMHLPPYRQLAWSLIHLPFHLAMSLFIQGTSQFVTWWKIKEVLASVNSLFEHAFDNMPDDVTSKTDFFAGTLDNTTAAIFSAYPPKYQDVWVSANESLQALYDVPESMWDKFTGELDDPQLLVILRPFYQLYITIENSLFATFKFAGFDNTKAGTDETEAGYQLTVNENNWGKFYLVFTYAYICAGITLILMNTLFIFSRTKNWSLFNYIRVGTNYIVGVALCLVALVVLNEDNAEAFMDTPWMLPSICLVFFFVLVFNHLPKNTPLFFRRRHAPVVDKESGRAESWEVVGHLGDRSRRDHKKYGPVGVTAEPGYEAVSLRAQTP